MGRKKSILESKADSKFKSVNDFKRYSSLTVTESYRKESGLSKSEHEFIINECSKLIIEEIVNKNDGFKLPERLGTILVIGAKPDVPVKDHNLYRKDKRIYQRNSNTGGLIFKSTYLNKRKSEGRYENCRLFTFASSVPLRKAIKEKIAKNKVSQWTVVDEFSQRYYKNTNIVPIPREEWLASKEERREKYRLQRELRELRLKELEININNDQTGDSIQT